MDQVTAVRAERLSHPDFFGSASRTGGGKVHKINASDKEHKNGNDAKRIDICLITVIHIMPQFGI